MSSRAAVEPVAVAARPIIYLGMDVHKDSITVAVLPEGAEAQTVESRILTFVAVKLRNRPWARRPCLDLRLSVTSRAAELHGVGRSA